MATAISTSDDITEAEKQSAVRCERLICVDAKNANNNKFWHGFVLANGDYFAEWGRVGVTRQAQRKRLGQSAADREVTKAVQKRLNYSGSKTPYVHQKTVSNSAATGSQSSRGGARAGIGGAALKEAAKRDIGTSPEIAKLVAWLADVNVHAIVKNTNISYNDTTGLFSTPLGLVTKDGIDEARALLSELGDLMAAGNSGHKFIDTAAEYFQIIPSNAGMAKVTTLLPNMAAIQTQGQILDSLDASLVSATKPNSKTKTKTKTTDDKVFSCQLELVDDKKVIDNIRKKYHKTRQTMHSGVYRYDVHTVYRVNIDHMNLAFRDHPVVKRNHNVWQLWHGTKASNLLSIMKIGMIVPPTSSGHVTGRMFGDGLYFSDQSTKALNYATNFWGVGGATNRLFMFLVDVAMGKYHTPRSYGGSRLPNGYDSTFAEGSKSGVHNNEMIVPQTAQANPKYLVEFR